MSVVLDFWNDHNSRLQFYMMLRMSYEHPLILIASDETQSCVL